jgi:hypothetical protein
VLSDFPLLRKLPKTKDLRLAEFCKFLIQLEDCLCPFSDQVAMQWSGMQCFYGLSDDLIIRYFWSLCLKLQESSVEIWQCFFLVLST